MILGKGLLWGERVSYALKDVLGDKAPRRLDRLSEMAVYASALALKDLGPFDPERAAVFFGTDYGNFSGTTTFLAKLKEKGARFASPIEFPNLVLSAPAGTLSLQFGFKGELLTFNGGNEALWAAHECLEAGRADIALVVMAEEQSQARDECAPGQHFEGAAALLLDKGPLDLSKSILELAR